MNAAPPGTRRAEPAPPRLPEFTRRPWLGALAGAALAGLLWLPALRVPFWQDDYEFLILNRDAIARGEPWWASLAPSHGAIFWRPLSAGIYWRSVMGWLHGNAVLAHLVNLVFLVLSAWSAGWLASALVARVPPSRGESVPPPRGENAPAPRGENAAVPGFWAAFLFGIHTSRLVPVAWASAIQESVGAAFAAFALIAWIDVLATARVRGVILCPLFFGAALLSKESAVATPLIAAVIAWWFRRDIRSPRRVTWVAVVTVAMTVGWLAVRRAFLTAPAAGSYYELQLGANVARNAGSLLLFALGAPREAFRFVIEAHSWPAAAWGAACVALGTTAALFLFRSASPRLDRRARVALLLIFALALAPYLPLRWNCYEYYVSLALVSWTAVIAAGDPGDRRFRRGVFAATAGAFLASTVVFTLPSPGVIGRAREAERDLQAITRGAEGAGGVAFRADDPRRSRAMGDAAGIAFRLHLPLTSVPPVAGAADTASTRPLVVIGRDGIRVER